MLEERNIQKAEFIDFDYINRRKTYNPYRGLVGFGPCLKNNDIIENITETIIYPGCSTQNGRRPFNISIIVPPPHAVTIPARTDKNRVSPLCNATFVPLKANTHVDI